MGDGAASESYCDINVQRKGFPLRPVEAYPRPLADLRGGTIKKGTIDPPTSILIVMELDYTRAIKMFNLPLLTMRGEVGVASPVTALLQTNIGSWSVSSQ